VLFYCTLVFALVGWGQKWLIIGALAAALLYSGQAAVHACLLAWRGPTTGENDVYALVAILSTAALITIPLLNWSKSLRKLYLDKARSDDEGERDFSRARTIIIYWGFLVTIGLFSVLFLVVGLAYGKFFDGTYPVLDATISCLLSGPPSNFSSLQFKRLPFNLTSTFKSNQSFVNFPAINLEWAAEHGCSNPCQSVPDRAIFRSADDYTLMSGDAMRIGMYIENTLTKKERSLLDFEYFVRSWSCFIFPYVILQGFWTAAFGRRSPVQTRDALYIYIRDLHIMQKRSRPFRRITAKTIALTAYLWGVFVTIICIPITIVTIVAVETYLNHIPESETLAHIDSWAPWAGASLALVAALIGRYERPVMELAHRVHTKQSSWRDVGQRIRNHARERFKSFQLPVINFFVTTSADEWRSFRSFWADADTAKRSNRHGRTLEALPNQTITPLRHAATMPVTMSKIVPRKSSWNTRSDSDSQLTPL